MTPTDLTATQLYREIHEQPGVLRRLLEKARPAVEALAAAIREREVTHVVIAARGTSDNAGRYAQYVFGAMNGLVVALAAPSLYTLYDRPPRFRNALVLGISQSGQSPDIVSVIREARSQGALTAVMTNRSRSPLAEAGEFVLNLHGGEERAVAATKTYTAELMTIAMLSAALSEDSGAHHDLNAVPDAIQSTLALEAHIKELAPRYRYMTRAVTIGRGFNYATACEMALKIKELTYVLVEPYSSADFLHGPLAMLEDGFPVFLIAPSGALDEEVADFVSRIQAFKPELVCISDSLTLLQQASFGLALPGALPEWLSPIAAIIPGQLLAIHLAHTRGYDVDTPRSISKVTETR
jgi:glucosamine--fructose-6-phosphate aminotransferase (isomerizing)